MSRRCASWASGRGADAPRARRPAGTPAGPGWKQCATSCAMGLCERVCWRAAAARVRCRACALVVVCPRPHNMASCVFPTSWGPLSFMARETKAQLDRYMKKIVEHSCSREAPAPGSQPPPLRPFRRQRLYHHPAHHAQLADKPLHAWRPRLFCEIAPGLLLKAPQPPICDHAHRAPCGRTTLLCHPTAARAVVPSPLPNTAQQHPYKQRSVNM